MSRDCCCIRNKDDKDLGVIMDSKFMFDKQVSNVCKKANRSWGFIRRNTKGFNNPDSVRYLYIILVRLLCMLH